MKWIKDTTGKFSYRPFFEDGELDERCEQIVIPFLSKDIGKVSFPINTADLERLVEEYTSDLDTYADLTHEGKNIQGMTIFFMNDDPKVLISRKLGDYMYENRRRTTLSHELGHTIFHRSLWDYQQIPLFERDNSSIVIQCMRRDIIGANKNNWLEWQAGYASGAILMPISRVKEVASEVHDLLGSSSIISTTSSPGFGLISRVRKTFSVSKLAAKIRLIQLGFVTEKEIAPVRF